MTEEKPKPQTWEERWSKVKVTSPEEAKARQTIQPLPMNKVTVGSLFNKSRKEIIEESS
jgi:hypothetical protein